MVNLGQTESINGKYTLVAFMRCTQSFTPNNLGFFVILKYLFLVVDLQTEVRVMECSNMEQEPGCAMRSTVDTGVQKDLPPSILGGPVEPGSKKSYA